MTPLDSWLLIAELVALLWILWRGLGWAFDLIERRHAERREQP